MNDMRKLLNKANETEDLREELRRVSRENSELKTAMRSKDRRIAELEQKVKHQEAELKGLVALSQFQYRTIKNTH